MFLDWRAHNHPNDIGSKQLFSQWGEISCQFLLPGGSIGPSYIFQLLISKKNIKLLITQQPLKLDKNKHRFGNLRILEFFMQVWLNSKTIKFYLIKLAKDLTTKLVGERASLGKSSCQFLPPGSIMAKLKSADRGPYSQHGGAGFGHVHLGRAHLDHALLRSRLRPKCHLGIVLLGRVFTSFYSKTV